MYNLFMESKSVAQRLLQKYSYGSSSLEVYSLMSMLKQTYAYLAIEFTPTKFDIDSYAKVLDNNQDGKITLIDLQHFCRKALSQSQCAQLQFQVEKNYELNNQPFGLLSNKQLLDIMKSSYFNSTNGASKISNQSLYQSHTSQGYQKLNENLIRSLERVNTQKLTLYLPLSNETYAQIPKDNSVILNKKSYNNLMLETINHQINENSEYDPYAPRSVMSQNYSSASHSSCIENQVIPQVTKDKYSKIIQKHLQLCKNIYIKNTNKLMRKVTQKQVQNLLRQTYEALGIYSFVPSSTDITIWMDLFDPNRDQQVQYIDYQNFVVYMLEKQGITTND